MYQPPCEHNRTDAGRAAGVCAMLGQRRKRWDNIVSTLAGRFVFAGEAMGLCRRDVGSS